MTTPNPSYLMIGLFDLTHINVRPPKFWRLMLEESNFDVKMSYVPSFHQILHEPSYTDS